MIKMASGNMLCVSVAKNRLQGYVHWSDKYTTTIPGMNTCMCVCVYVCVCMCVYVVCMCVYTSMHVCVCIYTRLAL